MPLSSTCLLHRSSPQSWAEAPRREDRLEQGFIVFSETEVLSSVPQQELPPNKNNNLKMPASTIQLWGGSHRKPSAGILLVFPRSSMVRQGGASPYGWSPQQTLTLPQYVAPFVLSLSSTVHLSLISLIAFSLSLSSLFLYIFFYPPSLYPFLLLSFKCIHSCVLEHSA